MSGLRVAIRTVALCTQNVSAPPIGGRSQPTTSTLLNVPMLSLAAVLLATSFFSSRPVPTLSTQVRSRRPRLTPHPAMTSPIPSAVSTPASIWSRRRQVIILGGLRQTQHQPPPPAAACIHRATRCRCVCRSSWVDHRSRGGIDAGTVLGCGSSEMAFDLGAIGSPDSSLCDTRGICSAGTGLGS